MLNPSFSVFNSVELNFFALTRTSFSSNFEKITKQVVSFVRGLKTFFIGKIAPFVTGVLRVR